VLSRRGRASHAAGFDDGGEKPQVLQLDASLDAFRLYGGHIKQDMG